MDERWAAMVAGARAMMAKRQRATHADFGLDDSMQYHWDTERAEIVFRKAGTPVARADL